MGYAITQQEALSYIPEVTWSITPATPTMKLLRYTSIGSTQGKTTTESNEVTTARAVADIIRTAQQGGLTFGYEMSYGLLDDFSESLFGGTWTTNVLKVAATRK